ncbi:MAG: hypothetical protein K0R92_3500, partial [Lachnospiraceae bacterium]|nr:hypothetical protein [Lachnospiraceae bacterium]
MKGRGFMKKKLLGLLLCLSLVGTMFVG